MKQNIIEAVLKANNGNFVTVTFTKKDGSERVLTGRAGVTKYLRGGKRTTDPKKYFILYEIDNGYRCVNLDTVSQIKAQGKVIDIQHKGE